MMKPAPRHAWWMIAALVLAAAPAQAEPLLPDLRAIIDPPGTGNTPDPDTDAWASTAAHECLKAYQLMSFRSPVSGLVPLLESGGAVDGLRVHVAPGAVSGVEALYFDYQYYDGYYNYVVTGITADPAICDAPSILACVLAYVSEVEAWVIDVITDPNAHMPSADADGETPYSGPPTVGDALKCV
jgi:hypothetical protein